MKKIILFILSLSILFVLPGCGGGNGGGGEVPSQPRWAKSYGGTGRDSANSIQQTSDGGYIVAGETSSFGTGSSDFWAMKLDSSGNITWQKTYGETGGIHFIQQTSDSGYIVAGSIRFGGHLGGPIKLLVVKLDSSGNIQWQKTYSGGTSHDYANSIQQTSDGGYIVAGETSSFGAGSSDFWAMKLDSSGNITWQKTYGGTGDDVASSLQQTSDGGYIVAGRTRSFGAGSSDFWSSDFWAMKLDSSGNITWQKTYGGTGDDVASSLQQTSDGGYIVAGRTGSFGAGSSDFWVIKLNSSGNIIWQKTYSGGTSHDYANSIQQTSDGGYIVAGETSSFGAGSSDFWVIKLNSSGAIIWQKTFGGTSDDSANSIQQTSDGGYIVAGETSSFGAGSRDFWVLRLKSDGTISSTAPSWIGADTSATVQDTSVVPSDTFVTPVDSTATVTDTFVTGVDSNATVQTQASD